MFETEVNLNLPEIISKEFFEKSIKNGLKINDNIDINEIKISDGSVSGNNYVSRIYHCEIKFNRTQNVFVIVKLIKSNNPKTDVINEFCGFQKEVHTYAEIIPKIEKLYKNVEKFAPKYFYSTEQCPYKILVLEDLKPSGYVLVDRTQGFDEAQSKIVLQKLGRYHAATLVLLKNGSNINEVFKKGFYCVSGINFKDFQNVIMSGLNQFIAYVEKWNAFNGILKKLKICNKNFEKKITECLTPKSNDIRVLNHSDFRLNNILFQVENETVQDINFIDFQLCTIDSLGMDINYFFNTSVHLEVLKTKREELTRHYYISLRNSLAQLQYPETDIPNWECVQNDIKKREFFGFTTALSVRPLIVLDYDTSKDFDLEKIVDPNELHKLRAKIYSTESYQKFMKYSVKRFDELGIFD